MDSDRYLERINYGGPTDPTLDTLCALHLAHMRTVPFENLDIRRGKRIVLDEARLFDKIVTRRRGGFCYELNGLFAGLLRALGYQVDMLAARVPRADGSLGIPFDHLTLRVELDEPWLVDVGFGDSFSEPLRLAEGVEQTQDKATYRIMEDGTGRLLQREEDGAWMPQYQFGLESYRLSDFAGGCEYHQTSPDSPFTRRRVCTMAIPGGRVTLSDMKLIVRQGTDRTERLLTNENEYTAALRDHFKMVLE
jgi:N-hydroxyarylamine O-acetyltransferase